MERRVDPWSRHLAGLVGILWLAHASAQSVVDGFDPEPNQSVCAVAIQADGKVLASGAFTTIGGGSRSVLARLNSDGTLDNGYSPSVDGAVYSLQIQPDGKLLIAGAFANVNSLTRNNLARLNADGGLDLTFVPMLDAFSETDIWSSALQRDGKLLVVGDFTLTGVPGHVLLARMDADGSLDATFEQLPNEGAGNLVAVALQDDGRVLVGGDFTSLGGANNLARLSSHGAIDTKFDLQIDGPVATFARQTDGKILLGGQFEHVSGQSHSHVARLNADGTLDANFDAGILDGLAVWSIAAQPDGKIVLYGDFTSVNEYGRDHIARLNPDGSVDLSFNPGMNQYSECPQTLVPQPDGKLLVGGNFTVIGGHPISRLARLHPDGSVDATFDPDANADVQSISVQPDGKVLAGGEFTTIGNQVVGNLARVNPDGSLDTSFSPNVRGKPDARTWVATILSQQDGGMVIGGKFAMAGGEFRNNLARFTDEGDLDIGFNPGVEGQVNALVQQTDGKIVVAGALDLIGGFFRRGVGRVDAAGVTDPDFDPNVEGIVYSLAVQPDGAVLIGGNFSTVGGVSRTGLARVDSGGHLDIGFNPGIRGGVAALALQPDGKILIVGGFDQVDDEPRANIARLNPSGTIDIGFNPGASGGAKSLALQADGKILVGGDFTQIGNLNIQYMARLTSGGMVDIGFNPGVRASVSGVAAQVDGKSLLGGLFEMVGDQDRDHFARLTASDSTQQTIVATPTAITWLRGGPMPELDRAWFDQSSDGSNWLPLGEAHRVAGGWMLDDLHLPLQQTLLIRGRGVARGGLFTSSTSLLEDVVQIVIRDEMFVDGFDG